MRQVDFNLPLFSRKQGAIIIIHVRFFFFFRMKIAVLADINANYPALLKVSQHIEDWNPDLVIGYRSHIISSH